MESKPWLKHYDEGVPHSLQPYPDSTLLEVIGDTVRQRPEHTMLIFKGRRLSYGEIEQISNEFAAALVELGVAKGDRVALLLPNSPQAIICQLGAWKAGAIVAPINPLYTERELEHALNECGAETVVVLTSFYSKLKSLQPRTHVQHVIATNIKEYLPPTTRLLFTLFREKKEGHRATLQPEDHWLNDLLSQHANAPRPEVPVEPSDPALLLFTGGTTGTPKGAVGTHKALLTAAMQTHAWASSIVDDWQAMGILLMPMFHVYGNLGVFTTALIGRYRMAIVPNPRDLDDLIATIRKVRPDFLHGVPTLFNALINHPEVQSGKAEINSMKVCVSAASPLLLETKNRFEALTGGRIIEAYAQTESMLSSAITPPMGLYKEGAVGIPLPDVEMRIADIDSGEGSLAPGEIGEILVRAPQLMQGYWQRPEETAEIIRDGWLHTGDIGYMDEDGYLFIVDRIKDLIKPSGFQVWPREVEEVIASHPAVAEVGVGGVPDPYQSEAVKAWIVLQKGQQASADEIRAYCRENLAAYKVPKHIEFRDSLPKTMVGKVLRRELVRSEVD